MPKVKKLIGFDESQIAALNQIAALSNATFTSVVAQAVDEFVKLRTSEALPIARSIIQRDAALLEMLSKS